MVGYRCYILDADDHIVQAYELDCDTDAQAEARAVGLLARDPYYHGAELWEATRRVTKLERDSTQREGVARSRPLPGQTLRSATRS